MRFDCDTFGPYLRRERERRRITLDEIAGRTKIARSLLAKLERGDVGDWPAGIFRRSFFREYTAAIGLDADPLLEEFLRLYPDPSAEKPVDRARTPASDLRLTLDAAPEPRAAHARLQRALVDTAAILAVTALLAAVFGHAAAIAATIAIVYHAVTMLWRERVPGAPVSTGNAPPEVLEPAARPSRLDTRFADQPRRSRARRGEGKWIAAERRSLIADR